MSDRPPPHPDLGPLLPIRRLGAGVRGQVFLAALPQRTGVLAVKVLRPEVVRDARVVAEYLALAGRLSRLRHQHIATLIEARYLPDGQVVVASEYLDGRDLERRVNRGGPLAVAPALHVASQVCAGLGAAHADGLWHLDLNPRNVFLVNDGTATGLVKLLDFGQAALRPPEAEDAGGGGFRAPEVVAGRPAPDARADVYSVGALLVYLLTGVAPTDPLAAAEAVTAEEAAAALPLELAEVILRCVAPARRDRWASVLDLADELRRHLGRTPTQDEEVAEASGEASPGVVRRCPACGTLHPPHLTSCAKDGEALEAPRVIAAETPAPRPGSTIGPYYVVRTIGEGGMARIYLVEHVLLGHQRAIKMLLPERSHSGTAVQRFFHEARVIAQLSHPHIIEVFEFVQRVGSENYYVMEFLEGASLASLLRQRGRLSPARAVGIAGQVCDALGAVHLTGLVHRDLKPENIFLLDSGPCRDYVKLLDFGVAKLVDAAGHPLRITRSGIAVGTVEYMAPEQARGADDVDLRADVYALGAILFEMLTGRLPYEATTLGELLVQQHARPVPAPSAVVGSAAGITPALDAVILCCLQSRPEKRFASMHDVETALERAMGG